MIPTPTKRRNYQQQEYPAQDELEDEEDENENENKNDNERETTNSEASKDGVLFNGFSINNKKRCINNQQVFKDNKCCGQFSHTESNAASNSVDDYDENGEELREEEVEEEEELGVVGEDEDEDFDYLRLDTIVEEDENSDMEDDEDLGHLDDDDSDFECDNNDDRKLVTKNNKAAAQQRQQKGKTSAAYAASVAPKEGLLNEETKQLLGQKQQKNGENNNNNDGSSSNDNVRPLAEHYSSNLLLNSMRKFSTTSTYHQQKGDENILNKETTNTTKQSIQNEEKSDSTSSKCDKLTNTKKMQTRQQQQGNQIHQPLPSTNRLISEHQARQQQALFRALAERQKMMDEIGADERIDLMSTASLQVLRQQQQQKQQQQQQNRRKKRRSAFGRGGGGGDKNRLNSSSKNNKPEGPFPSSSIEDGVPLSAVDLSSMSDRMLDELLGHIASASSSSLSSNGESIDSSDLSSGNSSGDELDGGSQRLRSNISATTLSEAAAATTTTRSHNRIVSSNQLSDTPNIIGVHEDERTRTNGCIINNNSHQTNNNNNHFTQALNNKAKRQLNCRNTHRRSCDNEDDQNDDDEDDDDNNDHELVVHLNNTSDQLHDSSLSPINHKVSEHQHNNNKKKPNSSNNNNKSSKLEEYFTSGLVNPHEFSEGSESSESVTPASSSGNKLLTSRQQQQHQRMISSKQAPTSACKVAASSAAPSKQSVEEVLSQMLGALNEISADDQEQLNDLLERGFTHLEQLLNCNLGGGNSNLTAASTTSSSPVGSVTNQLAATSTTTTTPTTTTTLSATNTSSLNQRQRQQHNINTTHVNPLLTRSQHHQPNNMAQKLISNQQQQQQQQQLSQSNAATLSKDSDYGSDTQSADCFSHYNDSSASSSNDHSNFTNISNQSVSSSSNGRWTMMVNNQHGGDVQSSESPSPTSLTTTSACSSTSAQHCSSSTSSSPIIGGGKTTPSMPTSTTTGRATAITVKSGGANSNSMQIPQTNSQPSQSMSTLSPLAIELSFKLAESLHRLAQQQAATRRDSTQTSAEFQQQKQHDDPSIVHHVANSERNASFSSNGNGCVNLSSSDIKHESDIEKQPIAGNTTMQKVVPQSTQKKSPMKSIVMINATRSPSAASIVSTSSSSNDFVSVQQQSQQQQLQRNLTPVQGDISTSSPSYSPSFGEVNINKQSSHTPTTTKQQFKTCVSIGSSNGVSSVLVGSTSATVASTTTTTTKDFNSQKCEEGEEVAVSPKKNRKSSEKRVSESIVDDCDGNEDLKSNIKEELKKKNNKNNKCQELEREKEGTSSENIKQQKAAVAAAISTAAVNFERARSSRSSLRRRPSFSGSTCSTKEPGAPRPGSPVPRLLLEEPRGLNYASSEMKNMNNISNNSSSNIEANNSLVTEHKKQQKQLQRALILAQKYNYSPTKLAASKLSSKLQLKDLTATSAQFNALSSPSSSPTWTTTSATAINGSQTLNRFGNGFAVDSSRQDHNWITSDDSKHTLNSVGSNKTVLQQQQYPIRISGQVELDISYFAKSGSLTVHVLQCSQLAPVSKRRTTSNPYVKLYLLPDRSKNGKRKSSIQKSQLNPKFDEKFTFGPIQLSDFEDRILWLSVWHKDRLGRNEFLGEILIPLSQIRHQLLTSDFCQSTSPKWYQLRERFDASASIKQGQRQFNWQQNSKLNSKTTSGGQQWFAQENNNNSSQQLSWPSTTLKYGKLNQGSGNFKDIKEATTTTSANRLQVDLLTAQSTTRKQHSSQVDNAIDRLGELQRKAFRLTSAVALPADSNTNNEHPYNHMNVHLGPITQLNLNQTNSISGQLFVALKFVPENQEKMISSKVVRDISGELHVIIKEAHNIGGFEATQLLSTLNDPNQKDSTNQQQQQVNGQQQQQATTIIKPPNGPLPNPFCKCYLLASNGQRIAKQKTPHLKRTTNPRWDFKCIFNSVKLSQLSCQAIEILMFNRDSILVSNNDYLGGIRLCQASRVPSPSATDQQQQPVDESATTTTTTAKVNEATQDEPLCSERESRLWNQMLARPNIWVYGELRLRQLRPLIAVNNNVEIS